MMKINLLIGTSALALTAAFSNARATSFTYTGGFQYFTVPNTGIYDIEVFGAQGGAGGGGGEGGGDAGGYGAFASGDILLNAGDELAIAVGGQGGHGTLGGGGGGGGSWVTDLGFNFLAVAGGGGGASFCGEGGCANGYSQSNSSLGGGGSVGGPAGGGGGGGVFGDGFGGSGRQGGGGSALLGGLAGGAGYGASGGFGGGGGPGYNGGGGGGGSYGGNGGYNYNGGGGGGSYLSENFANLLEIADDNGGNGFASVNYVSGVPEPASLALMGAGLAGCGVIRRRKRK